MAKNKTQQPDIPGEVGKLIITDDQFFWRERDDGKNAIAVKCVSPMAVRAAFNQLPIDAGWLPENVRRWGATPRGDWAVMFIPPGRQRLLFNDFPEDGVHALEVTLPGLVFTGYGSAYYVWAVQGAELQPSARTYHAPFPNLDGAGKVCFGTNSLPRVSGPGMAKAWKLFLESPFTAHLLNGKSNNKKFQDDVRLQLFDLHQPRRRKYPLNDLVRRRSTLDQSIQNLLGPHWQ